MRKNSRTKKLSKRQLRQQKQLYKNIVISTLMCLLVLGISYVIFITDVLQPTVNEVTASYISFNNNDSTDIIKITNIKKMSNDMGKSIVNSKYSRLLISGEKNSNYQVVIYPIINDIDLEYINYALVVDNDTYEGNLATGNMSSDEGIIVYNDVVGENNKVTVKLWVSKEYKGEVNNNSFKIKINPSQEN